jgi:hypothetical protein
VELDVGDYWRHIEDMMAADEEAEGVAAAAEWAPGC